MRRRWLRVGFLLPLLVLVLVLTSAARAAPAPDRFPVLDRYFITSDGARLHYLEAGPPTGHTLVFIPGWTMPAWIWAEQLRTFGRTYHVIAFDPRGQGESDAPPRGYEPNRRAQDIAELIANLTPVPVVMVAWSLGVLDTLAYVHTHGDGLLAGLVLVDNSVGEEPPPTPLPAPRHPAPRLSYPEAMRRFVQGLFVRSPGEAYVEQLTRASLRTPEAAARLLRSYPLPRTYWREAVYATDRPVLYVVRPRWAAQAENLARNRPGTESAIFTTAGHALFVDEPARFDALLASFLRRRIWP